MDELAFSITVMMGKIGTMFAIVSGPDWAPDIVRDEDGFTVRFGPFLFKVFA